MSDATRMDSSSGRIGNRNGRRGADREGRARGRLFRKYVLLIVGLVALVLLLNGALDLWFGYRENEAALFRIQQEKADAAAARIGGFVEEIDRQIGWTTHAQWATEPIEQRRFDYFRLMRQVPPITELIQLDGAGKEELRVSRLEIDVVGGGKDDSQSPAFVEAQKQRVWFGPVYFRKQSEPYMTLSMAQAGRDPGVTVAEVNLKLIWDVINALKVGKGGYAYVVDGQGRLIAHPDISLVLRDTDLSQFPQVAAALAAGSAVAPSATSGGGSAQTRSPAGGAGSTQTPSPAGGGGSGWGQAEPAVTIAKSIDGRPVLSAHAAIPALGWTVFVEVPTSEALAPLYGSAMRTAGLLLLALVLAALAALFLARRMTVPIRQLQAGAARIGAGELDRRIDIHTGDELEDLAGDFNRMAGDLQESYAGLEKKVEDRTAELKESLDQQTATSEVLQVINSSPGELAPVFDAMLEKAMHLCDAAFAQLWTYDGDAHHLVSSRGLPPALQAFLQGPQRLSPQTAHGRIAAGERVVHITDIAAEEAYRSGDPHRRRMADIAGARSLLAVSLRQDEKLLGVLAIYRQEVRPFTDKQIALLQNFAAQAVIAMENARLLTETREALEQQTATAEVLQVINSSPGDLAPVFDAILEKAHALCGASSGGLVVFEDDKYKGVAVRGEPEFIEYWRQLGWIRVPSGNDNLLLQRLRRGELVHIADATVDNGSERSESYRRLVELSGARTLILVPLCKDDALLGAITAFRQEDRPFTDKQIALLENFAAQAVIAMENARLLTETREALEQQTATAEVLQVINSSPGDLAPVFDAIVEKAMHLCDATFGYMVGRKDGEAGHTLATREIPADYAEFRKRNPVRAGQAGTAARIRAGEPFVHTLDLKDDDLYRRGDPQRRAMVDLGGARTSLIVALKRGPDFVGTINLYRQEVRPFTDKQIALLQNFAAQAVIAMENARLITETREALEQQTATAEVLQVINSSPGDLDPVFSTMLEKAMRLCTAAFGYLMTFDGEHFQPVAHRGLPAPFADYLLRMDQPGPSGAYARIRAGVPLVHVGDLKEGEVYRTSPLRQALADLGGARTGLVVALRKDESLLGVFTIYRQEVRPFADKEIALLQNFAAQAVIAMENARLLTETREALEQQTATAEVLQVINSSPGDLAPVFEAVLDRATSLCDAAFGILWTYDGERFYPVALHRLPKAFADFLRDYQSTGVAAQPGAAGLGAMLRGDAFVHLLDAAEGELYQSRRSPINLAFVELGGARSGLIVPLRKEGVLLGAIRLFRQEVRPFTDKQIALLQNFAAQAVIAMENARLITETREALEQQTATAEVLQVINSSPGDLAPVFDAMLNKAMRLCEASGGALRSYDGDAFHAAAMRGAPEAFWEATRTVRPDPSTALGRIEHGERVVQVANLTDTVHPLAQTRRRREMVELGGIRTALWVALRKEDTLLGTFVLYRSETRPFTDKQIALVENFAAQAVIAMENARLINETREALEQQTATAEVLQVINSSPGDLAPVFDAILGKAIDVCGAAFGTLWTYDGEHFDPVALGRVPPAFAAYLSQKPFPTEPGSTHERLIRGERFVQIEDVAAATVIGPARRALVEGGGARTVINVPLRKDDRLLGSITAFRQEVRPFTDKQIALLQNFAAQAVIAMENARLLTETREALEQQTATAEVLQVINSSPGDLDPVFSTMLEKAMRLCTAAFGYLMTFDGEHFQPVGHRGLPAPFADYLLRMDQPGPSGAYARIRAGVPLVHVGDLKEGEVYRTSPLRQALVDLGGARTGLVVALRKDEALLGVFTIYRQEVRPFADKEIALLQNFAAQAVIAMENARLLTETREALEQQTATAEVLQVINSSPGDLAPVFDAMLEKAMHLCDAGFGTLWTYDGAYVHAAALYNVPPIFAEFLARAPHPVGPDSAHGRLLRGEAVVHISDIVAEEAYRLGDPIRRALVELGGGRALLAVPLRKDDAFLGDFVIYREEARPFSDKQIVLLQNFAAQAVIAMENARLLGELRQRTGDLQESLEYQTAISDVLKVISRSTFDLDAVMAAVVNSAIRLCRADHAGIYRNENGEYRWAGGYAPTSAYEEHERDLVILPGPGTVVGRAALEGHAVQIADAWTDPLYEAKDDAQEGGVHTMLGVPLLREGSPIGVIGLARNRVELFTEKQIALVTTFADQAVIAIENARLFNELRQRTSDLEESLEYQTATSDVLRIISQSGAQLDPVLQTLVETAARICDADKAVLQQLRDGLFRMGASFGFPQEFMDYRARNPIRLDRGTPIGRMALERQVVHVADAFEDPEFADSESRLLGEFRTMLAVPLFREDAVVGGLFLARSRVEPFTEKQIALVTTFADQAVIAIENARLLGELRERTAELGRSVEELKVLGEVGRAVSSTLDLRAVLSTVLTRSVGLSEADAGAVFRYSRAERLFRLVEAFGWDEALLRSVGDLRIAAAETAMGEAAAMRAPIQIADLAERPNAPLRDASLAVGFRGVLIVPLVGPERVFGALVLQRRATGEFPAETVRLMQTLASQSVLAIQNARLFREIADKSEQLALASEHKSQFLANMSHELRTPLNAILGYAELLVDGIYGVLPEKAQGVLERVQNNGKHLLALINDVLDLAKIEAGQLTLTLEDYNLPELVRTVVTATEPLAAAKGLKFTTSLQEGMPLGHGDARRLSQVLLNLVGNAIKFTDQGEVAINASAGNGQFVLTVRDTGPGIADADQERIFGEFQQIENADTRKKGGTGLGLAISKRMVEMQGGMISVESAPGRGSTFRVALPVQVEPALEEAAE